jgi:hypothetical protein
MRNLKRNLSHVFFKTLEGQEEIIDQYGNSTGNFIPVYSKIKHTQLCISPNKGSIEVEQFGAVLDYDRTMTTADVNCEIDEDSVLWLDGADTGGPWNYRVKKRAPWKNSVSYAVKQVAVTEYLEEQRYIDRLKKKAVSTDADNQV